MGSWCHAQENFYLSMLHRGLESLAEISAIHKGLVGYQDAKIAAALCNTHFMYTKGTQGTVHIMESVIPLQHLSLMQLR